MKKSRRVTILLDDDLHRKLRVMQAVMIKKSAKTVSLSKVINQTLEKSLK